MAIDRSLNNDGFFVTCEPLRQLTGHTSYGLHVHSDTPESAAKCATHLGRTVRFVTACPGLFTCTCTEDSRYLAKAV